MNLKSNIEVTSFPFKRTFKKNYAVIPKVIIIIVFIKGSYIYLYNCCPNKNSKLKLLGSSRPLEIYSIFTTNLNSKNILYKDKILCILLYKSPFKRQIIMLP